MKLQGLSVAVTGGAGFIGSHLVDALAARGNRVTAFDNFATGRPENLAAHAGSDRVRIIRGDVRRPPELQAALAGAEVVFHLATHCVRLSLSDPATNHEVNATGTLRALMAAKSAGVRRFVYCSSSEVYGNTAAGGGVLSEESPRVPTTVYGASKLVGEHYTLAYHQSYGLQGMVLRPFNTYGPRAHVTGPYGEVIPRFAVWIRSGRRPVILGDGRQTRDYTYVEDTVACMIAAAECDALVGDSVNIARGEEVSVLELARTLSDLEGKPVAPEHAEPRPGDIRRLGADIGKYRRLVGPPPTTPLRAGLARYLGWLEEQAPDYEALAQSLSTKNWLPE